MLIDNFKRHKYDEKPFMFQILGATQQPTCDDYNNKKKKKIKQIAKGESFMILIGNSNRDIFIIPSMDIHTYVKVYIFFCVCV